MSKQLWSRIELVLSVLSLAGIIVFAAGLVWALIVAPWPVWALLIGGIVMVGAHQGIEDFLMDKITFTCRSVEPCIKRGAAGLDSAALEEQPHTLQRPR